MTHDPRTNQQSFIALFSYARLVLVVFLSHEHSHNKKMKKKHPIDVTNHQPSVMTCDNREHPDT